MPRHLTVSHTTEYKYSEPVSFGRHRMMFRPRDSHSMRLLDTRLSIVPRPLQIRWAYDVFGNSVAYAEFGSVRSSSLTFHSEITILHYEQTDLTSLLSDAAKTFPFSYPDQELGDIRPVMELRFPDPQHILKSWAERFVDDSGHVTLSLLTSMAESIRSDFTYRGRPKSGTQSPIETLELRSGTCRDFAVLMIEALRSIGIAARFVSGYLCSASRVPRRGAGSTHAWVQVYLPGCGWFEIDPTNGIFGNRDLIRIAVATNPAQALPLSGTFVGNPGYFRGMEVSVNVVEQK